MQLSKRLGRAPVIIGTALLMQTVAMTPVVADEVYTYGYGGEGGALFDDPCHGNDVLVGFNYTAFDFMNSIAGVCQPVRDGHIVGHDYGLNTWGKAHGMTGAIRCPADTAIVGLQVAWQKNGFVFRVHGICHVIVGNVPSTFLSSNQYVLTTKLAGEGLTACPAGYYTIGLTGYYGTAIDKLGMKCRSISVADNAPPPSPPPPSPPPPPPPPAAPEQPTDDGGGATASADTTVYQVKGEDDDDTNQYLSVGDQVTIVSCGGDNWCEISKPFHGFVWGDDLNH